MIKLRDGQITDLLPEKIAQDIETQCLSYAIKQEHQRLLDLSDHTRTMSVIDELPERILDILAVELRTPYYQESMNLTTKREIIKRTLLWHTKAGTPSAVEELVEIVFGQGEVVEWFNFTEGEKIPGTFDIVTNARLTEDIASYFLSIIQRVKNTRSHIRRILIEREMEMHETVASGAVTHPETPILNHHNTKAAHTHREHVGAATVSSPSEVVTNSPQGRKGSLCGAIRGAGATVTSPSETIGNNVAPRQQGIHTTGYRVAMAKSTTQITILNGAFESAVAIKAGVKSAAGATSHSTIQI